MVKIKRICLTLSIVLLFLSCSVDRFGYSAEKYGHEENFVWDFVMLIQNYSGTYNKSPQSATDLMTYIDGMDKESRLIVEGYYRYDYQYLYLKNNQDKLIFVTDSVISIYYKKVKEKNLLVYTSPSTPCASVAVPNVDFFDKDGLVVWSETLSAEAMNRLYREYWDYAYKTKDNSNGKIEFEKTKFEYTPNNLRDLCKDETLDINQSPLIKNTFDYLDSLAHANDFSRIIASGFR